MSSSSKLVKLNDLPQELLCDILIRIRDQDWLAFGVPDIKNPPALTCKRWHALISTQSFWRRYHSYWRSGLPQHLFRINMPWQYFASIRVHHIYERNLVVNPSGEWTDPEEFIGNVQLLSI